MSERSYHGATSRSLKLQDTAMLFIPKKSTYHQAVCYITLNKKNITYQGHLYISCGVLVNKNGSQDHHMVQSFRSEIKLQETAMRQ